jgi:hypothetical protein
VTGPLKADGTKVIAAPLPLTSLDVTAERMGAHARARPVDHSPLVTAPAEVVDTIRDAMSEVTTST